MAALIALRLGRSPSPTFAFHEDPTGGGVGYYLWALISTSFRRKQIHFHLLEASDVAISISRSVEIAFTGGRSSPPRSSVVIETPWRLAHFVVHTSKDSLLFNRTVHAPHMKITQLSIKAMSYIFLIYTCANTVPVCRELFEKNEGTANPFIAKQLYFGARRWEKGFRFLHDMNCCILLQDRLSHCSDMRHGLAPLAPAPPMTKCEKKGAIMRLAHCRINRPSPCVEVLCRVSSAKIRNRIGPGISPWRLISTGVSSAETHFYVQQESPTGQSPVVGNSRQPANGRSTPLTGLSLVRLPRGYALLCAL
jgi:hypothetical protein